MIDQISTGSGLTKDSVSTVIDMLLDGIIDAVAEGDKVSLSPIGTFKLAFRKERVGRNLKTGELITIPARRSIIFKPSTAVIAALNCEEIDNG